MYNISYFHLIICTGGDSMIQLGFGSDKETKDVYNSLKELIKKDMFPEYAITIFEENKACDSFRFTIAYDEDYVYSYMVWYEAGILNIEPEKEDYEVEDIAFILYPIAEMLL